MTSDIRGSCHVKENGEIDSLVSTGISVNYLHLYIPAVVLGGPVWSDWGILAACDVQPYQDYDEYRRSCQYHQNGRLGTLVFVFSPTKTTNALFLCAGNV